MIFGASGGDFIHISTPEDSIISAVGVLEGFTGLVRISSDILFSVLLHEGCRLFPVVGGPLLLVVYGIQSVHCNTTEYYAMVLDAGLTALNGREMLIGI